MRQNKDGNCCCEENGKVLGITGGVGAGKSTVLSYLRKQYGARILEADRIGHLVQQPGELCWKHIIETFGNEILAEDGTIDRGRLGAIVYADRKKMEQLNAIVHPAVKKRILEEIASFRAQTLAEDFLVIEAALLLEDHYDDICDEVWYIYADESTRAKRLMGSRGYSPEKIRQIMQNQLREEEFRRRCQVVIDNSREDMTCTCAQIDERIKKLFPKCTIESYRNA
ncbi:MAG: dephospho-CoA kinase [Lachnospiraceae bacterium]|nr:dephospho-CoA kinase [Lachnospiraceae bacterium]